MWLYTLIGLPFMAEIFISLYASPPVGRQVSVVLQGCPDFEIVEITTSADVLRTAMSKHKSQVLLLDRQRDSGESSGLLDVITMLNDIRSRHFNTKSLVLASCLDMDHVKQSLEAGALGYLMLQPNLDRLLPAIRLVNSGKLALDPEIMHLLLQQL